MLEISRLRYRHPQASPGRISCENLRAYPGSWIRVVGPSGHGKSTLVRLAAGWLEPESGTITFNGTRTTESAPGLISLMPQDPLAGFHAQRSVLWSLREPARLTNGEHHFRQCIFEVMPSMTFAAHKSMGKVRDEYFAPAMAYPRHQFQASSQVPREAQTCTGLSLAQSLMLTNRESHQVHP